MSEISQPDAVAPARAADRIADDQDKSLDPSSVTVSRISSAIWLLILFMPLSVVLLLVFFFSDSGLLWAGGGLAGFIVFAAWRMYWPGLSYRHASYRVAENGLWIRRGVVWRSQISIPKSRVQHTDVSQGPLQRRFAIATLVLHTAGTQHAAVALPGLSYEAALAIRDYLIEGGEGDAV